MLKIKYLSTLLLVVIINLSAQNIFDEILKLPSKNDNQSVRFNKRNFYLLPLAGYGEDTGVFGGGIFKYYFKKSKTPTGSISSSFRALLIYTYENQKRLSLSLDDYNSRFKSKLYLDLTFRDWQKSYYGKGGETSKENKTNYDCEYLSFSAEYKKEFFDGVYLGLKSVLSMDKGINFTTENNFSYLTGVGDYNYSGFGPVIELDTRDNNISPTSGIFFKSETLFYVKIIKDSYRFRTQKISLKSYLDMQKITEIDYSVLASRLEYHISDGDVPFMVLPGFGGNKNMRGLSTGRFKDKQALYGELEYRTRVYERLGMTLFAGVGNVGSDFSNIFESDLKSIVGIGFRYQLNSAGVNFRLDIGYSFDDQEAAKIFSGNEAY